jgi:hypothetical protein
MSEPVISVFVAHKLQQHKKFCKFYMADLDAEVLSNDEFIVYLYNASKTSNWKAQVRNTALYCGLSEAKVKRCFRTLAGKGYLKPSINHRQYGEWVVAKPIHGLTENFGMLPIEILYNEKFTTRARRAAAYMLNRPEGWELCSDELCRVLQCNHKTMLRALKELKDAGYLCHRRMRHTDGKVMTSIYVMVDTLEHDLRIPENIPAICFERDIAVGKLKATYTKKSIDRTHAELVSEAVHAERVEAAKPTEQPAKKVAAKVTKTAPVNVPGTETISDVIDTDKTPAIIDDELQGKKLQGTKLQGENWGTDYRENNTLNRIKQKIERGATLREATSFFYIIKKSPEEILREADLNLGLDEERSPRKLAKYHVQKFLNETTVGQMMMINRHDHITLRTARKAIDWYISGRLTVQELMTVCSAMTGSRPWQKDLADYMDRQSELAYNALDDIRIDLGKDIADLVLSIPDNDVFTNLYDVRSSYYQRFMNYGGRHSIHEFTRHRLNDMASARNELLRLVGDNGEDMQRNLITLQYEGGMSVTRCNALAVFYAVASAAGRIEWFEVDPTKQKLIEKALLKSAALRNIFFVAAPAHLPEHMQRKVLEAKAKAQYDRDLALLLEAGVLTKILN